MTQTVDLVPPSCCQICRLDTQVSQDGGYSLSMKMSYRAESDGWGRGGRAEHQPALHPDGLHAPFSTYS